MWAPGAYKLQGRETLPAPNIGVERYFFDVADTILSRIKESRNTVIVPSARARSPTCCTRPPATPPTTSTTARGSSPTRSRPAPSGSRRRQADPRDADGRPAAVGFRPHFELEGRLEAIEFADGNYGLLEGALQYSRDDAPPVATSSPRRHAGQPRRSTGASRGPARRRSSTTRPTARRRPWPRRSTRTRARAVPARCSAIDRLGRPHVKWIAVDIKGNVSAVQTQTFLIGPDGRRQRHGAGHAVADARRPGERSARSRRASTRDYNATTTATVISTAGDAALRSPTRARRDRQAGQRRVHARRSPCRSRRRARAARAGYAPVGGSASPTPLLDLRRPGRNDPVAIGFRQSIAPTTRCGPARTARR